MKPFVRTPEFKEFNVGIELDEAGACATEQFLFFSAEKAIWRKTSTK